eukprot:gene16663-biopygen23292
MYPMWVSALTCAPTSRDSHATLLPGTRQLRKTWDALVTHPKMRAGLDRAREHCAKAHAFLTRELSRVPFVVEERTGSFIWLGFARADALDTRKERVRMWAPSSERPRAAAAAASGGGRRRNNVRTSLCNTVQGIGFGVGGAVKQTFHRNLSSIAGGGRTSRSRGAAATQRRGRGLWRGSRSQRAMPLSRGVPTQRYSDPGHKKKAVSPTQTGSDSDLGLSLTRTGSDSLRPTTKSDSDPTPHFPGQSDRCHIFFWAVRPAPYFSGQSDRRHIFRADRPAPYFPGSQTGAIFSPGSQTGATIFPGFQTGVIFSRQSDWCNFVPGSPAFRAVRLA